MHDDWFRCCWLKIDLQFLHMFFFYSYEIKPKQSHLVFVYSFYCLFIRLAICLRASVYCCWCGFFFVYSVDLPDSRHNRSVVYFCLHYAFHMDKNCNVFVVFFFCFVWNVHNKMTSKKKITAKYVRTSIQRENAKTSWAYTQHLINIDMNFFLCIFIGIELDSTNNANVFSTTLTMSCIGRANTAILVWLLSLNGFFFAGEREKKDNFLCVVTTQQNGIKKSQIPKRIANRLFFFCSFSAIYRVQMITS